MNTRKSIIGLIAGLTALTGLAGTADAASDFKVIRKYQICQWPLKMVH